MKLDGLHFDELIPQPTSEDLNVSNLVFEQPDMIKLADILQRISRQLRKAGLEKDSLDDRTNEKFIEEKESEVKVCLSILQKLKV